MRSVILALLSLLVMSCGMMIHNADDIINDMRDNRHAEYFNVGSGINSAKTSRIFTRTVPMRKSSPRNRATESKERCSCAATVSI